MKHLLEKFKIYVADLWIILKTAGSSFSDNNALKLSASLSYYTIFSLAPTLIVIIAITGIFYGQEAIQGKVYGQIASLVGSDAAKQVQDLIKNAHRSDQSIWASIIGIVTLFIGATGVFLEIQSSINTLWSLKTKPKKGIVKFILSQIISFSMVISLGFLLLVSLVISAFLDIFLESLQTTLFAGLTIYLVYIVNIAITFSIITLLFGSIFKILPDAKMRFKDVFVGAAFTATLFMIGKLLIGLYLGNTQVASLYGSASSVILILLWVYYSSIILYFGAEFTKAYATKFGYGIAPKSYAVLTDQHA